MDQLYTYKKNGRINELLIRIEVAKKVIDLLPQLPHIEANLRRQSLLKSSLFSARIEGNTLELHEIDGSKKGKAREKKEVLNILQALEWIHSNKSPKLITKEVLLTLHAYVLDGVGYDLGKFRQEPSAIFNQAGIAVYMTPPPTHLPYLLDQLIGYIAKEEDHPGVSAAVSHFTFEKIHPFIDGNGRVGRLLASLILKQRDYALRGLAGMEEYFNDRRSDYYDLLSITENDITPFVEFFLEGIAESAEKTFEQLKNAKKERVEDTLLPRRQEILQIIREQRLCSFNMIKRRFRKIPDSSLHYDIQVLLRKGIIKKLGTTRGVVYCSNNTT
ncbi:MAG: Fic family protein [Candidatus Roizmanbacteria bacterium]|nr:Fic family protein [Candidatus Roizmanbacteria bacterium]